MPPQKKYNHRLSVVYSDKTEQALQEIVYYLQTQTLGEMVNRSDAIRYAVELAAINIRQEREAE
jgi:Arc/MetJ-type ribon-helix-helix transcriptional regulator